MGVWRDSSQPRIEKTDAVGNCKQLEKDRLKTGGWRRHEFLCSLDTDRLMGVKDAIKAGATVHTDGSAAYRHLKKEGYVHQQSVMLGSDTPAHVSMPGVHRVAALIHRWLLGTHQGAVQPAQLDYYLDEFVFRFNRRQSLSRGMLFYRLLEQAVVTDPVTYQDVVAQSMLRIVQPVELSG